MPLRLSLLAGCALLATVPALAQPPAPTENLSKKLDQSGGVIPAPKDPDPGMSKGAPTTGDPSVIKPPATGGGEAPVAK